MAITKKYYYKSGEEIKVGDIISSSITGIIFSIAIVENITPSANFPIRISCKEKLAENFPMMPYELKFIARKEWLTWL